MEKFKYMCLLITTLTLLITLSIFFFAFVSNISFDGLKHIAGRLNNSNINRPIYSYVTEHVDYYAYFSKNIVERIELGQSSRDLLAWIESLSNKENRTYSQNGEDGITLEIFSRIGSASKFFVEFGVQDGTQCNTRILREHYGWIGVMFDNEHVNPSINLIQKTITIDNVRSSFEHAKVPLIFDYLSLDINFGDLWMLKKILDVGYRPRVVVVEINMNHDAFTALSVQEEDTNAGIGWDETKYFGASALAFTKLMHNYEYQLVYIENAMINAFFIEKSELNNFDASLVSWVHKLQKKSTDFLTGYHQMDKKNRKWTHICHRWPCRSLSDF